VMALILSSICAPNSIPLSTVLLGDVTSSLHSGVNSKRNKCLMLLIYCKNCGVMLICMLLQARLMHMHFCRTTVTLSFLAYSPIGAHCT